MLPGLCVWNKLVALLTLMDKMQEGKVPCIGALRRDSVTLYQLVCSEI